jgi:subtilisin family serine protease
VLDTGADLTHPWIQPRVMGGWDFVDDDPEPADAADACDNDYDGFMDEAVGHGTHVAGIVALAAPDAGLLIARVLDSDGRGDMMGVARAVRWAVANGAGTINMSLGGLEKSEAVAAALDEASAAGVVLVAAAGNWGASEPVEFPALHRQVIAVAAVDDGGTLAPFSSYGDIIGLCAPGVAIRSSYRDGGYALWSGTSMAAPWVAGGAALLQAQNPDWTRGQVVDRLRTTARRIWKENPSHRWDVGVGALDLGAALSADVVAVGGSQGGQ